MIQAHHQNLPGVHGLREIMKVDPEIGKLYYPTFASTFRPELGFRSRNSRRTYRPADATDIINAVNPYSSPESFIHFLAAMAPLQLQGLVERRMIPTNNDFELYYQATQPWEGSRT